MKDGGWVGMVRILKWFTKHERFDKWTYLFYSLPRSENEIQINTYRLTPVYQTRLNKDNLMQKSEKSNVGNFVTDSQPVSQTD